MSIAALHQRLEALHCPFLKYDSDFVAREVLAPGQVRQDILMWLFQRFDGENGCVQASLGENESSNIQVLHSLARTLGICQPGDVAVIEGGGSVPRQLDFMHTLLDLVELASGHSRTSLDMQVDKDLSLLTALCKENLSSVLTTECNLIPRDLLKLCEEPREDHRSSTVLAQTVESLEGQLEMQGVELKQLEARFVLKSPLGLAASSQPHHTDSRHLPRALSLSMSTFVQLAGSFVRTFETDFKAVIAQPVPRLVGAGPVAQRALIKWQKFREVIGKLKEIQDALEDICNISASCVRQLKDKDEKLIGKAALEEMHLFTSVMKSSILRKEQELSLA